MRVWIVRHTQAIAARGEGQTADAARPLSARGRAHAKALGKRLRDAGGLRDARECWHSGLVRARETAALFTRAAGSRATPRAVRGLAPDAAPATVAGRLDRWTRGDVILVGHEPQLSALASLLAAGRPRPVIFRLPKGAVLSLERLPQRHRIGRRRWIVHWVLTPELMA